MTLRRAEIVNLRAGVCSRKYMMAAAIVSGKAPEARRSRLPSLVMPLRMNGALKVEITLSGDL